MRTSSVRKTKTTPPQAAPTQAQILEFKKVAVQAERACHLPHNAEAPDFEEFMDKYAMKTAGFFE